MGYTHYYNFREGYTPSKEDFKEAVDLFKEQLDKIPETFICPCYGEIKKEGLLHSWDGTGEPVISDELISFNGDKDNEYDHESFVLRHVDAFGFCKTNRKPYDLAVCLCLLSFKEIFGDDFRYTTDGMTREDVEDVKNGDGSWRKEWGEPKAEAEWQLAYDIFDKEI